MKTIWVLAVLMVVGMAYSASPFQNLISGIFGGLQQAVSQIMQRIWVAPPAPQVQQSVAAPQAYTIGGTSLFDKATPELATEICKRELDANCECRLVAESASQKDFTCTNGWASGKGSCYADSETCTAEAMGMQRTVRISDYVG